MRVELRLPQLLEPCKWCAGGDARKSFPHEDRIRADAVLCDHVGRAMSLSGSDNLGFETHPTIQQQPSETFVRTFGDERRNLDPEEPHTADLGDVDGATVDDGSNQYGLGLLDRRKEGGSNGNGRHHERQQHLHCDLL
ncbi:MAG TPA: hypothetical protein VFP91_22565 [Vicinamibacterales bacterium]|nr:hypothetical protein [Vicinamibacterales bacterium]